jgi:hypothetical protein
MLTAEYRRVVRVSEWPPTIECMSMGVHDA